MTNPTPHGQAPEALIDLIDAYAETRHRCGGIYNAKTEAARKAVIEALSGVQALSAAPAEADMFWDAEDGERFGHDIDDIISDFGPGDRVKIDCAKRMPSIEVLVIEDGDDFTYQVISPTPPAEQQAQPGAVYAELPAPTASIGIDDAWHEPAMRDFADRTHALRMEQAAPKAAPGEQLTREQIREVFMANGFTVKEGQTDLKQYVYDAAHALLELVAAPQQEAQEPTTLDQKTMELAESVGLIGPASRIGDLHAAIQRFHDLICVNATIKAAVMAADVISGVATPARDYPPLPMQFACSGVFPVYSADQMRAYVDADRAAYASGSSQPAPAPLSDDAKDAARYRWLRATTNFATNSQGERIDVRNQPEKWDAAIDAALAKQGGQQ